MAFLVEALNAARASRRTLIMARLFGKKHTEVEHHRDYHLEIVMAQWRGKVYMLDHRRVNHISIDERVTGSKQSRLSFAVLRDANVRRCEEQFHSLKRWDLLQWSGAMSGEGGEAAEALLEVLAKVGKLSNTAKKITRANQPGDDQITLDDLGDEIADVGIYLDLFAARAGIDLGEAIARKFNRTSDKIGSDIKLPEGKTE